MIRLEAVEVAGVRLEAAFDGDLIWLPVKRLCEALDVGWDSQRQRIARSAELKARRALMSFDTDGGPQKMVALPSYSVPALLIGMKTSRHEERKRAAIEQLRAMSMAQLDDAFRAARTPD